MRNVILGAGISGIAAAYELKRNNVESIIFEKNNNWGGLLDNFSIEGFRFDKFVHFSFANDKYVNDIFFQTKYISHEPLSYNFYKGHWLKHPAQNNLFPLKKVEKEKIVDDFKSRKDKSVSEIKDYEEWLRVQYGDYFAENFPMVYTEKYWTITAKELETKWVGSRMYKPSLEEVERGCESSETPNTYYAKEMRYPSQGGYKAFITPMVRDIDIRTNSGVDKIDLHNKTIRLTDGKTYEFDNLISSLPLTEICKLINNVPEYVLEASEKLNYTSGYLVSLGFNKPEIADKLWFYIYDKDILPARVYSPSMKSSDNAPKGCSSIQAEIYYNRGKKLGISDSEILEQTIDKFISIGLFKEEDLIVKDIRSEKYANVVFDHAIYVNRKIVIDYLVQNDIISVGRFGEWEYFWSDQSLLSGRDGALKLINKLEKATKSDD
ncbi:protoporphyrinogen/coproporphyrinogen oxidase [Flavobacterium sp. XS2P39]|uniref:protoporphyrinogen/coproporphyrinogen oxidase n=1 Tax=Flavobacterium sp. XS2P39 TaxID=3401725 RepID=UPI003AAF8D1A